MTLSERLAETIRACFSGIWIQNCEHEEAILEIGRLCHDANWNLMTWDIDQGMRVAGGAETPLTETSGADPLAAVRALWAMGMTESATLLVLVNFHRFLNSAEIVQAMAHQIHHGKNRRTFLVGVSTTTPNSIFAETLN